MKGKRLVSITLAAVMAADMTTLPIRGYAQETVPPIAVASSAVLDSFVSSQAILKSMNIHVTNLSGILQESYKIERAEKAEEAHKLAAVKEEQIEIPMIEEIDDAFYETQITDEAQSIRAKAAFERKLEEAAKAAAAREEAERQAEAARILAEQEAAARAARAVQTASKQESSNSGSGSWDGTVLNPYIGVVYGPSGKESYYNLDMSGVIDIMRSMGYTGEYWVRADGCKMLGDYIMCAANLEIRPRGSLVESSLGTCIVVDTGWFSYSNPYQLDIAVTW